jgi:hypothetical protein
MPAEPNSLIAAVRYFADPAVCNHYIRRIKWPDGKIVCPKCDGGRIGEIATRHVLHPVIISNVEKGANLYSDAAAFLRLL